MKARKAGGWARWAAASAYAHTLIRSEDAFAKLMPALNLFLVDFVDFLKKVE
jgi:hypothetical protein